MKKEKTTKTCTYIGGQAVMEGVMMRGKRAMATAVRDPEGTIQIESERLTPPEKRSRFSKLPFVRGIFSFWTSMVDGNRVLMRSADVAITDDEVPTKAEKWLSEKHKIDVNAIFNTISTLVGVVLALLMFIALPQWVTGFLPKNIFDKTLSFV